MAFKIIPIAVSALAVAGVTILADKLIFKRETDPKQAIINALVVVVVLGVAGMVTRKTVGGTGLAEIPSKIANK
jgi:hypothetical protein